MSEMELDSRPGEAFYNRGGGGGGGLLCAK